MSEGTGVVFLPSRLLPFPFSLSLLFLPSPSLLSLIFFPFYFQILSLLPPLFLPLSPSLLPVQGVLFSILPLSSRSPYSPFSLPSFSPSASPFLPSLPSPFSLPLSPSTPGPGSIRISLIFLIIRRWCRAPPDSSPCDLFRLLIRGRI